MTYAIYIIMFLAAVAIIIGASQWAWQRSINSMPKPPHLVDAVRFIWVECYGMEWLRCPRIITVRGGPYECNGQLVMGHNDDRAITVSIEAGELLAGSALAHELRHAARAQMGLHPDGEHRSPDWQPGGAVDKARKGLRERGW